MPRKRRDSTRTGRKKPGRQAIQRCAVGREAAARHDAMDMRMLLERLPPGVQDGEHADLGAQMLGIGGDGAQRLGRCPEQHAVDHGLVLEGDLGDRQPAR